MSTEANYLPLAAEILEVEKAMAPLEARMDVLKKSLREAAPIGTITVTGLGTVQVCKPTESKSTTKWEVDVAKLDADAEVKAYLISAGILVEKTSATPAKVSAIKTTLNA